MRKLVVLAVMAIASLSMAETIVCGETLSTPYGTMSVTKSQIFPNLNWHDLTVHEDRAVSYFMEKTGITSDGYNGVFPFVYDPVYHNIRLLLAYNGGIFSMSGIHYSYLAFPENQGFKVVIAQYLQGKLINSWDWFFENCREIQKP